MITAPVLTQPDFSHEYVMEKVMCHYKGWGAILTQNGRTIPYYSYTLRERNLAKSFYENSSRHLLYSIGVLT
jgi:hypothetical protein